MTGIEMLFGVTAVAGKEAIKQVIESIYKTSQGPLKNSIKKLQNERHISQLFTQIGKVRKVKTLGQLDKAVDLMSFYCHSYAYIDGQRKRILSIKDFPANEHILIEGIAGQGKSIFLRYLCATELYRGQYVPVFVELRKISASKSLMHQILSTLETYNIDLSRKQFGDLADSGRLLLLLDAFDEIPEELKERVVDDIEHLALKHENLRMVVTSRPESGLHACPVFRNIKLSNLEGEEYASVINKICGDAEIERQLIKEVQRHKGDIKHLLQTPLLVTLLVIRYKSYQELPQQLSEFYDSLFQVLLQRHDGSKPGYKRQRKGTLNDAQYRQVFEAFCFLSKHHNKLRLTESIVYEVADKSIKERGFQHSADAFVNDIVKITCLLVRDGEEFRFIHKSVQEFYAACYIRNRPEIVAKHLYRRLFHEVTWLFTQELRFLFEVDRYRYHKYGELAYLSELFQIPEDSFRKAPSAECFAVIRKRLEELKIHICEFEGETALGGFEIPTYGPFYMNIRDIYDRMVIDPLVKYFGFAKENASASDKVKRYTIKLIDWPEPLTNRDIPQINMAELSKAITDELFSVARKAWVYVDKEENIPNLS